jgi:hypothetical protein
MKVLVGGPQYPDSFGRSTAVTLEQMGYQVGSGVPELTRGLPEHKFLSLLEGS